MYITFSLSSKEALFSFFLALCAKKEVASFTKCEGPPILLHYVPINIDQLLLRDKRIDLLGNHGLTLHILTPLFDVVRRGLQCA